MKVIFVAGAWGSGTSAMAGALVKLGVTLDGPTFGTNDPRTPDSFESEAFRSLVLKYVREENPTVVVHRRKLLDDLITLRVNMEANWNWPTDRPKRAVLKLPAASACLQEMHEAFDLRVVTMQRPVDEIRESCRRRGWHTSYAAASDQLYELIFRAMAELGKSHLRIAYHELTTAPKSTLQRTMDFLELNDLAENLNAAANFIRSPAG